MLPAERLTGALLDRLTHHVHIREMNGDSYRLPASKKRARKAASMTEPESRNDASQEAKGGTGEST
jgi:hypothetical protein